MSSSYIQGSTPSSSNHGYKKESSKIIQSRRAKFFSTYQSQEFCLPDSIMFHIAKNPTSTELYQKLIQTCKYFFVKNPILVIPDFGYVGGKWKYSFKKRLIDLPENTSKLWITDLLLINPKNSAKNEDVNLLSSLMPKLYRCDAKYVSAKNQIISFHDLSLLISAAERIHFDDVTVRNKDGSNIAFEKIVEIAVKAKKILIRSVPTLSFTSETMKELIKLPHFLKLEIFDLNRIPEAFDLESFYGYMKKNKNTKFLLRFDNSISEAYKNRLEEIVDEILATETHDYMPPSIYFVGLDEEKYDQLFEPSHY